MVVWSLRCVRPLKPHGLQPPRLLCPWDFPGKNTGVGCHFLLQGLFPTQGLNPGLQHCRQILYRLSYEGSPTFLHTFVFYLIASENWYSTKEIIRIKAKGKQDLREIKWLHFFFFFLPKDIYWNVVNLNCSFHTIVGYSEIETNLRACRKRPSLIKVMQDSFSNHKPRLGYICSSN